MTNFNFIEKDSERRISLPSDYVVLAESYDSKFTYVTLVGDERVWNCATKWEELEKELNILRYYECNNQIIQS
jgi:hypothetical protein